MRDLRIGEVVRFSAIDDFTGEEMELIGEVIGNHEAVKKQFPEECEDVVPGFYLVKVGRQSGLFVISRDEVLEVIGEV